MARVLKVRATVKELVQVNGVSLFGLFTLHDNAAFIGVHIFESRGGLNTVGELSGGTLLVELEILGSKLLDSHLGLQVALSIKGCGLNKALVGFKFSFEEDTVSGDLLVVLNHNNITDGDIGKGGCDPLTISTTMCDWDSVDLFIFLVTLHFSNEFFKNTEGNDEGKRNQDSEGGIGLNRRDALHDSSYTVENVHDLSKLEGQGNREEVPPGVTGGLAFVTGLLLLVVRNVVFEHQGSHTMSVVCAGTFPDQSHGGHFCLCGIFFSISHNKFK